MLNIQIYKFSLLVSPEPLPPAPVSEEPPLPSRPPKTTANFGSPKGKSWYHSALDRKQAETKLRKYNKVCGYCKKKSY